MEPEAAIEAAAEPASEPAGEAAAESEAAVTETKPASVKRKAPTKRKAKA